MIFSDLAAQLEFRISDFFFMDSFQGDSGGPLVFNNELVGVVNFNFP